MVHTHTHTRAHVYKYSWIIIAYYHLPRFSFVAAAATDGQSSLASVPVVGWKEESQPSWTYHFLNSLLLVKSPRVKDIYKVQLLGSVSAAVDAWVWEKYITLSPSCCNNKRRRHINSSNSKLAPFLLLCSHTRRLPPLTVVFTRHKIVRLILFATSCGYRHRRSWRYSTVRVYTFPCGLASTLISKLFSFLKKKLWSVFFYYYYLCWRKKMKKKNDLLFLNQLFYSLSL